MDLINNQILSSSAKHELPEDEQSLRDGQRVKRLRGGGYDDDQELYDEEAFMDDGMEEPEEYDVENTDGAAADNADTAINFDDLSAAQLKRWSRPPVPQEVYDTTNNDLNLQWLDIDLIGGDPLPYNPNSNKKKVVGATSGEVPIIRVYGCTDAGNSIVAFIHGYTPYGYFALPENFELKYDSDAEKNRILGKIRDVINDRLVSAKSARSKGFENATLVHGVQYIEDHKSIMGYNTSHTKFLKVFVSMPSLVPTLKRIMEEGISLPGIAPIAGTNNQNMWQDGAANGSSYQPFECNVVFVLRFMIDEEICGAGWLSLKKGTYEIKKQKTTNCQVRFPTKTKCSALDTHSNYDSFIFIVGSECIV